MIEELHAASGLLGAALDRYYDACSAIVNSYDPVDSLSAISEAIPQAIPAELDLISLYGAKFKRARVAIRRTRNIIPAVVPINTLPPDILTHVFKLVFDTPPWNIRVQDTASVSSLKYPQTLAHVCSHWRRVAINSCSLWSNIYLIPLGSTILTSDPPDCSAASGRQLFTRAKAFAARAGYTPLDLRVVGGLYSNSKDVIVDLDTFCASVGARIGRLQIESCLLPSVYLAAICSCFANCTPGELRQLVITGRRNGQTIPKFIEAAEAPIHTDSLLLDIPAQLLEDILQSVRVLYLDGTYFNWTSRAYHGLVELRLTRKHSERTSITQSQLRGILAASPSLRIFQFGIDLVDIEHSEPINLYDLEVLNLRSLRSDQREALLSLISPGSTPLQLLLRLVSHPPSELPTPRLDTLFGYELKRFIARSNVTELLLENNADGVYSPRLHELLKSVSFPGLRALCLHGFKSSRICHCDNCMRLEGESAILDGQGLRSISEDKYPHLQTLSLIDCAIVLNDLQQVVRVFPIQEIRVKFIGPGQYPVLVFPGHDQPQGHSLAQAPQELSKALPGVKLKFHSDIAFSGEWDLWP